MILHFCRMLGNKFKMNSNLIELDVDQTVFYSHAVQAVAIIGQAVRLYEVCLLFVFKLQHYSK